MLHRHHFQKLPMMKAQTPSNAPNAQSSLFPYPGQTLEVPNLLTPSPRKPFDPGGKIPRYYSFGKYRWSFQGNPQRSNNQKKGPPSSTGACSPRFREALGLPQGGRKWLFFCQSFPQLVGISCGLMYAVSLLNDNGNAVKSCHAFCLPRWNNTGCRNEATMH